jgi:hypothetical protein
MSDSLIKALERSASHRRGKKKRKAGKKRRTKRRVPRGGHPVTNATPAALVALLRRNGVGFTDRRTKRRKPKRKAAKKRAAPKRRKVAKKRRAKKSGKRKLKFGSPAWRKKYMR